MSWRPGFFILSLIAVTSGSALAQVAPDASTGSRIPGASETQPVAHLGAPIPETSAQFPVVKAREVMSKFADCAVKKRPLLAHEMVIDASKQGVDTKYRAVGDPACLAQASVGDFSVNQLKMTPDMFRFFVADALIKVNLSAFDPLQLRQAGPVVTPPVDPADFVPKAGHYYRKSDLEELELYKRMAQSAVALTRYGQCVVRADPLGSRRLLGTQVNSDDELAALRALMPAFSSCLDKGAQFRADRAELRGTIALNYYRLAYAPKQPVQTVAQ